MECVAQLGRGLVNESAAKQVPPDLCGRPRAGGLVPDASPDVDGLPEVRVAGLVPSARLGRSARPVQELRAIGRLRRHLERLDEVGECLLVRVEPGGAVRRPAQGDARLRRHRGTFVAVGRRAIGVEVVGRKHAGDLLVPEGLEESGGGQVPAASIAP